MTSVHLRRAWPGVGPPPGGVPRINRDSPQAKGLMMWAPLVGNDAQALAYTVENAGWSSSGGRAPIVDNAANFVFSPGPMGVGPEFDTNDHTIYWSNANSTRFRRQEFSLSIWFCARKNITGARRTFAGIDSRCVLACEANLFLGSAAIGAGGKWGGVNRGLVAKTFNDTDIGKPHLLQFSFSSSNASQKLFFDGKLAASRSDSGTLEYFSGRGLSLGRSKWNNAENCASDIKDFRYYDYAIDEHMARAMYDPSSRWELWETNLRPKLYFVPGAPPPASTIKPASIMLGV